jgi:uncharacterized protein
MSIPMRTTVPLLVLLLLLISCARHDHETLQTFHLYDVELLESPFHNAQQASLQYILELDVDRLLAPFIREAGLTPPEESYGSWENSGLDGHTGGHYLSALSLMYASTGNPELLRRLEYMIDWLARCQETNANGYVGGIPGGKAMWEEIGRGEINAANFSLNNKWVPWYNIHKLFAGLRDAYLIAGNEKARDILVKLSDWAIDLTKDLTHEQVQAMLISEHGGMNEVLVDVAEITGDEKYLELADKFSHRVLLDPLLREENTLAGLHANTQIPKVVGFQRYAETTNNREWHRASEFFWDTVIDTWTVSIGGNSAHEHFHPADDFSSMITSNQGPETCNTYNMLRLSKHLFLANPDNRYMDYYERALYNHILSSQHPHGGYVYFTPMHPRHYRVYSQPHQCFWCCVGTGLENHGKYGEMIYLHNDNDIFINLFIPSVLTWESKEITLTQNTSFPYEEKTTLTLNTDKPRRFGLNIRIPEWIDKDEFNIQVNGETQRIGTLTGIYASVDRTWRDGDVVTVSLPMKTRIEYLPDGSSWASILHGPVVLAAITGRDDLEGVFADDSRWAHIANGPQYPIEGAPVIVSRDKDFSNMILPSPERPLSFIMPDIIYPTDNSNLTLIPFFEIHEARYMIYWPVVTPDSLEMKPMSYR